uniref:Uncharacterized protein n=1 Tax=Arundo donax TaxID=35708 RepID=A0A0A9EKS4_ARUDO
MLLPSCEICYHFQLIRQGKKVLLGAANDCPVGSSLFECE